MKIKVSTAVIALLCIGFASCGPRSGIHQEEEACGNKEEPVGLCGNAVQESVNADWVMNAYGLNGNPARGQKLFKQNCAVCHSLNDNRYTGVGLMGVINRVPKPEIEWLKKYILNSEKVLKSGDAYAKKLHIESGGIPMTVFEGQLTDEELNDLLIYVLANTR